MSTPSAAAIAREVSAAVRGNPLPAIVSALICAVMVWLCLMTVGRTAAAEAAVLARIDDVGARSIIVRATQDGAGLDPAMVRELQRVASIEQVLGVGSAQDATAGTILTSGKPVAVRLGWGTVGGLDLQQWRTQWESRWHPAPAAQPALSTESARIAAGLADPVGPLRLRDGNGVTVMGPLASDSLTPLEPLVVIPAGSGDDADLATIVITTRSTADITPVTETVRGLLKGRDPTRISLSTSQELADLTALVRGDLAGYGRSTVLLVLLVGLVVESLVTLAWVASRRRDIGRRRALGATRALAAALLLGQVAGAALVGAAVGGALGLLLLRWLARVDIPVSFAAAIAVLSILTAVVGAATPVVTAVRRDPVRVLRQP